VAEAVNLVVDRGVLLDVGVGLRKVGLWLVVVVVGDKVVNRVFREELVELVAKLCGKGLVVGDHQRWPLHGLDDVGDSERLSGSGRPEERLKLHSRRDPLGKLCDRSRLVPPWN